MRKYLITYNSDNSTHQISLNAKTVTELFYKFKDCFNRKLVIIDIQVF